MSSYLELRFVSELPAILEPDTEYRVKADGAAFYDAYQTNNQGVISATPLRTSSAEAEAAAQIALDAAVDAAVARAAAEALLVGYQALLPDTPEDYGAIGDGVADDTAALEALIAHSKADQVPIALRAGSTYRTVRSLWLGTDNGVESVVSLIGNWGKILGECTGEPVLDLTGIRNDGRFLLTNVHVTGDSTNTPSSAALESRPLNGTTVVSSGNAYIHDNRFDGSYSDVTLGNIQSESNSIQYNYLFNDDGPCFVMSMTDVLGISSPNATGGSREDSTASYQIIWGNFFNNRSATSLEPPVQIYDWSSFDFTSNNLNVSNPLNSLMRCISRTSTVQDGTITRNYLHNTHLNSFEFGDPLNAGGTYKNMQIFANHQVGNPTNDFGVINSGSLLTSCKIHVNESIDLGDADLRDMSSLEVRDNLGSSITASGTLEGEHYVMSDTVLNITTADAANRATFHFVDMGMSSGPARSEVTIDDGAIEISRPYHTIDTESDIASDNLDTINVVNGQVLANQEIVLRLASASRQVRVLTSGGNIRGTHSPTLTDTNQMLVLQLDATAGHWKIKSSEHAFTTDEKNKLAAIQRLTLDADEAAVNNSATPVDTAIAFDVKAGEKYTIQLQGFYDTVTGAGARFALAADGGAVLSGNWAVLDGANSIASSDITANLTPTAGTTNRSYSASGVVSSDIDATITLQFAQGTATAGDTILKENTNLRVELAEAV